MNILYEEENSLLFGWEGAGWRFASFPENVPMQLALAASGERIVASQQVKGHCPQCREELIAKCGQINVHHWSHKTGDCDPWWEPETDWHQKWKALMPIGQTEVTMAGHRADIVKKNGTVVELQHSPISAEEIQAREAAYGNMVWLFDASDISTAIKYQNGGEYFPLGKDREFNLDDDRSRIFLDPIRNEEKLLTLNWKWPRKHYAICQKPVYIDIGNERILIVKKINQNGKGSVELSRHEIFKAWLQA